MSQSDVFFSVIIPTYNRADLLLVAINSVLAQSFQNWELLVVDDGSTDQTGALVKGIQDERVKYLYQTNAERSAARNNGINQAKGQYICFLDSDDYYLPDRLNLLHKAIVKENSPVVMFYTGYMRDHDQVLHKAIVDYTSVKNVYDNLSINVVHSQQTCIAGSILKEFKFDRQFRIGEDLELWLRIAGRYPIRFLPDQDTVVIVEHDDRSVNLIKNNIGADQVQLYKFMFSEEHGGNHISKKVKLRLLSAAYQAIAKYHIFQENRFAAITAIIRAINIDKRSPLLKFRTNVLLKLIKQTPYAQLRELMSY